MNLPSFDDMLRLAQHHPEQLEQLRQQLIENLISSAPQDYQRRLRGIQFQVDAERQIASNPMSSCIRISKMMHDCLSELRQCVDQDIRSPRLPSQSHKSQNHQSQSHQEQAQILPFATRAAM